MLIRICDIVPLRTGLRRRKLPMFDGGSNALRHELYRYVQRRPALRLVQHGGESPSSSSLGRDVVDLRKYPG